MNSRAQFFASVGAFLVAFAFALREAAFLGPLGVEATATAFRAALVVGWLPTFVLAPLVDWFSRQDTGMVRLVPGVVCASGLAISVVLHPGQWMAATAIGLVCVAGFVGLDWLRRPTPSSVRVSIVGALLIIAFWFVASIHWAPKDGGEFVHVATATVILLLVPTATFGPIIFRVVTNVRVRKALSMVLWLGAIGLAVFVAGFDYGLYVPPKVFVAVALGAAIAVDAYEYPVSDRAHDRFAASLLCVALAPLVVSARIAPVPERFGPAPLDTLIGTAALLVSIGDDRDGDGFFDVDVGGNDCAPDERSSTLDIARCHVEAAPAGPPPSTKSFAAPVDHAFVFIVDALRPDVIDEVAEFRALTERGILFTRGYAPSNRTYASFRPMLTGVAEPAFLEAARADAGAHRGVGGGRGIFALEEMQHTVFLHSALFPDEPKGYLGQEPGVRAETALHTAAVVKAAETWLEKWTQDGRGRISMALYTRDPHAPYICANDVMGGRECYADEVAEVGRGIADFLELLATHEILDRSLVVILGDHGEAFGEHGHFYHASSLYEEQVRVPILLLHPSWSGGRRVDVPVSAMSLTATFADALHVRNTSAYTSLFAVASGAAKPRPPVVHDLRDHDRPFPPRQSAIVAGSDKLIYDWNAHRAKLFDLRHDAQELQDLAAARPDRANELVRRLFRQMLQTAVATGKR